MHGENTCLLLYKLLLGKQSLKVVFPLLYIPGVNGTIQIALYVFICYMIDEKCELLCIVHNKWNEKPTLLESHFWYLHELRLGSDGLGAASDQLSECVAHKPLKWPQPAIDMIHNISVERFE